MPEQRSLIDFGEVFQNMLRLGQLTETQRAHTLQEQNMQRQAEQFGQTHALQLEQEKRLGEQFKTTSQLQHERLVLEHEQQRTEQQKLKIDASKTAFTELEKIKDSPALALNRNAKMELTYRQADIMKNGLGVDVPLPSREEMAGGYEAMDTLLKTMHDPAVSAEQKAAAFDHAMVSNPVWAGKLLDDQKKAVDLSTEMEKRQVMLETNKLKFEALNTKMGQIKAQEGVLTEHMGGVGRVIGVANDPRFQPFVQRMMRFPDTDAGRLAKQAYLNLESTKDTREGFEKALMNDRIQVPMQAQLLKQDLDAKTSAVADYAAQHGGEVPVGMQEELASQKAVTLARMAEEQYIDDVFVGNYDPKKWTALNGQHAALQIEARVKAGKAQGITDDRMKIVAESRLAETQQVNKFKQESELATSKAQTYTLKNIKAGMPHNDAAVAAVEQVEKEGMLGVVDLTKLKNLEKAGRLDVQIKMGQEDVTRNLKLLEGSESAIDFTDRMLERIEQNPAIIGKGAKMGTAFAGATQQLRAITGMDPAAAKFLNTQTRDELEAFHEILVYQVAKTMDPSGALDLKVIEHARESVGDISSWATGPQQVVNKLQTVKANAERNMRRAKRRLQGIQKGYLEPTMGAGGEPPSAKPVTEMSEEELMKAYLGGVLQ